MQKWEYLYAQGYDEHGADRVKTVRRFVMAMIIRASLFWPS